MEPDFSLPHSQEAATYSIPSQINPVIALPTYFLNILLIFFPIYVYVFQAVFSLQVSPARKLYALPLSPIRATCTANFIHLSTSTTLEASHFSVASSVHVPRQSYDPNILLAPVFQNTLDPGSSLKVYLLEKKFDFSCSEC